MRQATGNTFIFGLVISFTLIFTGFLVLALNYSKAYKLKNEVSSMIEKYEGITINDSKNHLGSLSIINSYLRNSGYSSMGSCAVGDYGSNDLESLTLDKVNNTRDKYYYCISYTKKNSCDYLFRVTVFYDFNLPVLGNLRQYSVSGQTSEVPNAYFLGKALPC